MKEQTLLQMKNAVARNSQALEFLFQEVDKLQSFAVGMMNVMKKLPGYDEAIKELTIEQSKKAEELKAQEEQPIKVKAEDLAKMIVNEAEEVKPELKEGEA